jgi:pimeloyl-ACP methyl ester carboxylesterase
VERFATNPGNTPLREIPKDYSGGGTGRWFVLPDGSDAGKKMFFLEKRLGDGDGPTVLFVHGNPECSYTYRKVVSALERRSLPAGTRVIAMDHIGFGLSDQASYEMVDMHHARNLAQLVEMLDLRDVTLVVHDWGGPIGIGALLQSPERVTNLVVLNTSVFPMPADTLTYGNFPKPIAWAQTASLVPDRSWGAHAAWAVTYRGGRTGYGKVWARYSRFMLANLIGRLPDADTEAIRVFRDQFASKANARSSKRMVRQSAVYGHGYAYMDKRVGWQDNHAFYREIQQSIGPVWGPAGQAVEVAGVFGTWDPLGKESVVDQWRAALPQIEEDLQIFEGETHFIEERRPEEIADAIARLNASD